MKKFDNINIIPFVDIMLVLLAIVLTTSTLVEKRLMPISLPSSSSATKKIKSKDITITIKKDGTIFWEDKIISKKSLEEKIKSLNKDDNININCDKSAKFEDFIYIVDSLKNNNFQNISIITKKDE